jgi:hypothetical protein
MSPAEAFKLGFLSRCVEEGLSGSQIAGLSKQASDFFDKQAFASAAPSLGSTLLNAAGSVPSFLTGGAKSGLGMVRDVTGLAKDLSPLALLAAAAPPTIGGVAAVLKNQATDISEEDVGEAKQQELADTYHRMAEQLRRQQAARSFKKDRKQSGRVFM